MADVRERFFRKVEQPANGSACWPWIASKKSDGYGHFFFGGRMDTAHRASWMLFRGPIPTGLFVLHKCDNPSCVNPDHFFLGDHQANADDKMRKGRHTEKNKTHCKRGHELAGENLYIMPGSGARSCRHCARMRGRQYDSARRPATQGPRIGARKTLEDLPSREVAA
jgi:hypothetical protein